MSYNGIPSRYGKGYSGAAVSEPGKRARELAAKGLTSRQIALRTGVSQRHAARLIAMLK